MTPTPLAEVDLRRRRLPPPNQVPWVDELLWQWGTWVRRNDEAGYVGSALGRMYKQRMKELRVWDGGGTEPANCPGDDERMLEVDRAVARLPKRLQRLVKWRYWHGVTMPEIAKRLHRSLRTANIWLVEAQQGISSGL